MSHTYNSESKCKLSFHKCCCLKGSANICMAINHSLKCCCRESSPAKCEIINKSKHQCICFILSRSSQPHVTECKSSSHICCCIYGFVNICKATCHHCTCWLTSTETCRARAPHGCTCDINYEKCRSFTRHDH